MKGFKLSGNVRDVFATLKALSAKLQGWTVEQVSNYVAIVQAERKQFTEKRYAND